LIANCGHDFIRSWGSTWEARERNATVRDALSISEAQNVVKATPTTARVGNGLYNRFSWGVTKWVHKHSALGAR
jgi:hypothetical protein